MSDRCACGNRYESSSGLCHSCIQRGQTFCGSSDAEAISSAVAERPSIEASLRAMTKENERLLAESPSAEQELTTLRQQLAEARQEIERLRKERVV